MNQLTRNISSLEVAEMVGREHGNVIKDIRRIIEQLGGVTSYESYFIESTYMNMQNKQQPCFELTKKGCELYGTRMNGAQGTQFAVKYIERFNELEQEIMSKYSAPSNKLAEFEAHLIAAKYACEMLLVDDASKVRMLTEVHKAHGVPTNHLPVYVDEELKVSMTQLLKEHGVKMSAAKANTRLIELGLLEIKERPSSKGGVKEFKSLTGKGMYYGANAVSPQNAKETQPLYYPSKFGELIRLF